MEADLIVSASDDVHDRRILCDIRDGFLPRGFTAASFASDQDIEITHSIASTAQGACGSDCVDAIEFLDISGELLTFEFSCVNKEAPTNAAIIFNRLEKLGLVFFAHA